MSLFNKNTLGAMFACVVVSVVFVLDAVSADQSDNFVSAKRQFQEIQVACATAIAEPLNREDIEELRSCLNGLMLFEVSHQGSDLADTIANDLPLVPDVEWVSRQIEVSSDGNFYVDGRLNSHPIQLQLLLSADKNTNR